jgi:hypothetical protein
MCEKEYNKCIGDVAGNGLVFDSTHILQYVQLWKDPECQLNSWARVAD